MPLDAGNLREDGTLLQARTFLELQQMLLEFDLPEHTLAAWQHIF